MLYYGIIYATVDDINAVIDLFTSNYFDVVLRQILSNLKYCTVTVKSLFIIKMLNFIADLLH